MNWRIPAYFLVASISGYLTYLLIPIVKNYAIQKGYLDNPGPRKIHSTPIPRIGGAAFIVSYFAAVWLGFIAAPHLWFDNWIGITGMTAGGIIIFIVGFTDDLKNLSATTKLFWQIVAALIPVLAGIRPDILDVPFFRPVELGFWSIPLSVFWVVMITNTFNFLDGLDGLAAGIGAISALTFVILSIVLKIPLASLLAAGVFGICVGFLKFNYHPAKIFMGDSGSLFIGYTLGVLSLYWPKSYASLVMFVPIIALGLPVIEITVTTLRRLFTGKKLFVADKRHMFHYLLEQGLSHRGAVWIFYLVGFQFSLMAVGLVLGKAHIVLVLEVVFIIFIAVFLSRKLKSGGDNG